METTKNKRLSIDILPEEHKRIKLCAAIHGQSIREYILESVRERLRQEIEEKQLSAMATSLSPALQDLWDNEKDAAYDKI